MCALLTVVTVAGAAERSPLLPRVPDARMAQVKALENPIPVSPDSIQRGLEVFRGVGSCNVCHGEEGRGDGIGASGLDPGPRNLTSAKWQKVRSDGEIMWVLRHGSPGTAMITVVPGLISEEDGWHVINFIRSIKGR